MSSVPAPSDLFLSSDAIALERVRQLVEAENRHDLLRYHALLHDDFVERVDGSMVSSTAEDAALSAARGWAAAPRSRRYIHDLGLASGLVTVRWTLLDAVHPAGGDPAVRDFVGYTVYETADDRVLRAWHFVSQLRSRPDVVEHDAAVHDAAATAAATATATGEPRARVDAAVLARRVGRWALVPLAGAGSWIVQELVLAAPVIAAAARLGPAAAFALFAPLYFALSVAVSFVVLRRLSARGDAHAPHNAFTRWFEQTADSRSAGWARRTIQAGSVAGFAVASFYLGAPVTVWALHRTGVPRPLQRLAVVASAIWAVGLVGFYCGVVRLVTG
jgi:hypothetical protein